MTELDSEIGPIALEVIAEFGKSLQYAVVAGDGSNYDPATAGVGGAVSNFVPIKAIVEEYNGQSFVTGLIERGDKKVTVAAQSFAALPTTGDLVLIDGQTYSVVSVKITYSGDLAALYELQARR